MVNTLVSVADYFQLLQESDIKLEYHAGEIVAMAGEQPAHNIVAANILGEFFQCVKKQGCLIMSSDQLVKIEQCDIYTFPDLVVVCEPPIYEKSPNGLEALLNPSIIVEVLSDSTEIYDRSEKLECYQTLTSLKEYVLVASRKQKVEIFRKNENEEWVFQVYKTGKLPIGSCEITLASIYDRVTFE
ncbi:MAG: Uma2 family endonuclease [Spirosomataceae bacterium]